MTRIESVERLTPASSANLLICFTFPLDFAGTISDTLGQMSKAVTALIDHF